MKTETIAIHGRYQPDLTTKAVAVLIYQTTSYAFDYSQLGIEHIDDIIADVEQALEAAK